MAVGLGRRLAAIFYDGLLLAALLFAATAVLLPFTGGAGIVPGSYLYSSYLLAVCFIFFGWCWTHGGQTLGMRAWNIRVTQVNGQPVTWVRAAVRFALSLLSWAAGGTGFLWSLVDRDRMTWHDRGSGTRLMLASRKR